MSVAHQTTDHQQIKDWTVERGGVPAKVKDASQAGGALLRIHFPKHSEHKNELEEIDWDDFFTEFEKDELEFLYQNKKGDGAQSTFHKFVERR
ncbi:hypothetical protein PBAL39_20985 [Pedobacter sp. BAL39]|uniref:hypothetical protein n=1 Tax=Pedobacter sp. BAL39 TaxID=391596 RepID=UPI0001559798|nr:hypothetical protein [Pedobacter sp. BAL39]EDM38588.1 hypothetical protein PBAL39_20985 [Pedobacter sp. BAL39]